MVGGRDKVPDDTLRQSRTSQSRKIQCKQIDGEQNPADYAQYVTKPPSLLSRPSLCHTFRN